MIEITAEIRALIDKAAAGVELAEDEYIDLSDGLIHCKKCGGQRQTVVPCVGKPGYFMPRCICHKRRGWGVPFLPLSLFLSLSLSLTLSLVDECRTNVRRLSGARKEPCFGASQPAFAQPR